MAASAPVPISAELQLIVDHERVLRGKLERAETEIAAEEDAYLRQFPTGNLIQGMPYVICTILVRSDDTG